MSPLKSQVATTVYAIPASYTTSNRIIDLNVSTVYACAHVVYDIILRLVANIHTRNLGI